MKTDLFIPQDLQRDMLALQLAMDLPFNPAPEREGAQSSCRPLGKRRLKNCIADVVTRGEDSPATDARRSVSRTVEIAVPTRTAIDYTQVLAQSDVSITRGHAASPLSPRASRSFLFNSKRIASHLQATHARCLKRGRHHLGTRADCVGMQEDRNLPS